MTTVTAPGNKMVRRFTVDVFELEMATCALILTNALVQVRPTSLAISSTKMTATQQKRIR